MQLAVRFGLEKIVSERVREVVLDLPGRVLVAGKGSVPELWDDKAAERIKEILVSEMD